MFVDFLLIKIGFLAIVGAFGTIDSNGLPSIKSASFKRT
jgi:hypothetical protein